MAVDDVVQQFNGILGNESLIAEASVEAIVVNPAQFDWLGHPG